MEYDQEAVKNFFTKVLAEFKELSRSFQKESSDMNITGRRFKDAFEVNIKVL